MRTRSAGRLAAESRGGGTGGRADRGGGNVREPRRRNIPHTIVEPEGQGNDHGVGANVSVGGVPEFSTIIAQQLQNLLPIILPQVGNHVNNPENIVDDNTQGDVRNVIVNNARRGCTYKEFLACNPKEYDGKGGAIVYTRWIEKMESVQDMSGCEDNQKVKYTAGSFVGKALTWWNSEVNTRSREAAIGMTWEDFKTLIREEFCPSNEMFHELAKIVLHLVTLENRRIERYVYGLAPQIQGMVAATEPATIQKRGNSGELGRDRNARDDNKRGRTGNVFATTVNPVKRKYNGVAPKCAKCNLHHSPETPCHVCFNCNRPGHVAKDYRAPRLVNPVNARNPTMAPRACYECGGIDHIRSACPSLNRAQRPVGNHPNQAGAIEGGQNRENNRNQARGKAFIMGAEEAL
ncbi:reverse transcriptase domain-containing protein [Tanacetum coccineum]